MDRNPFYDSARLSGDYDPKLSPEKLKEPSLKTGRGTAAAHHGEIFQGVLEGASGRLQRGLVSLPCSIFRSEATFYPDLSGVVRVDPVWKIKTQNAVKLALDFLGKHGWGGRLKTRSNVPVGWGLGSSTSDVTAAIRAVADAFRDRVTPKDIAHLAVRAETASDSLMFDERMVLFAQREGVIIEDFNGLLPEIEVLGFNTDPSGNGVNTLDFIPVRYSWWEIEAFRPLIGRLRRAVETQDPYCIGEVATASAKINQKHLPKPRYDEVLLIKDRVGALGLQVAHSGTVVGLLFDPLDSRKDCQIRQAQTLLESLGFDQCWRFRTSASELYEVDEQELCEAEEVA